MKTALLILAGALRLLAQPVFFVSNYNTTVAATPTFSPAAGSVVSGTTVTISTNAGCGGSIYWNTTGSPTTSDNHGTTATVSIAETIYAKVIGCPNAGDSAVGSAAYTIAVQFNDNFSGSGALSGNWTRIASMSNGSTSIVQNSGVAQPSAGFNSAAALVSGVSLPRSQYSQVVISTLTGSGNAASVCVLATTGGNGYCSSGANVVKYTSGTGSFLFSSGCTGLASVGTTLKISSDASGNIVVYKNGVATCSGSDSTYTSGSAGLLLNDGNTSPATNVQVSSYQAGSN